MKDTTIETLADATASVLLSAMCLAAGAYWIHPWSFFVGVASMTYIMAWQKIRRERR